MPKRKSIGADLRQLVAHRANYLCEYCLIHEDDTHFGCQVDHIISLKHQGKDTSDNLAYACAFCNRAKGSDIGSIIWETRQFVRFFNPRLDNWADHFKLEGIIIRSRTEIGQVTVQILQFNSHERLLERQSLQAIGAYPSSIAQKHIE